MEEYPVE
jgi:sulfatase maturation enzyme AslB (radical SAM superfamily)